MNTQQILEKINGNFDVEHKAVYFYPSTKTNETVEVPRYSAIVRKDNDRPLSIVGEDYGIVQYRDAVSFLDQIMDKKSIQFDSGWVIDNGAKLYLLLKGAEAINLGPNEQIKAAFMVSSSHDGTGAIRISATPIYTPLQSIITPFGKAQIKIKHKSRVEQRISLSKIAIEKLFNYFEQNRDSYADLTTVKVSEENAKAYFGSLIESDSTRAENIKNKLYDIFLTSPLTSGLASCRGTLFGCFMAVVQYADLYKIVRKSKIRSPEDARVFSSLDGDGAKMKADALAFALKIMERGHFNF